MKKTVIVTDRIAVSQVEAARMIGVHRDKIRAAVHSGELTVHHLPGSHASKILVSALVDWVKSWPKKPRARKEITNGC